MAWPKAIRLIDGKNPAEFGIVNSMPIMPKTVFEPLSGQLILYRLAISSPEVFKIWNPQEFQKLSKDTTNLITLLFWTLDLPELIVEITSRA